MEYLKIAHGVFNILVMFLFFRQGWLGWQIRRGRLAGTPFAPTIRMHRRTGPYVAALGLAGYLAGATLSLIDHGHIGHHPAHLLTGTALVLCIGATFLVSRKLKGPAPQLRPIHTDLGIAILLLYPLQVVLGLAVLL